jgi:hypothetical protein
MRPPLADRVRALLADGKSMSQHKLAYRLECNYSSLGTLLARGMLVRVGREPVDDRAGTNFQKLGTPILALAEFAEQYGVEVPFYIRARAGRKKAA